MRKLAIMLCLLAAGASQALDPVWVLDVRLSTSWDVDALTELGLSVSGVEDGQAVVYATPRQREELDRQGVAYVVREMQPGGKALPAGYVSYAELTVRLSAHVQNFPELCRLVSLGQSVQGRELWAMLITKDPDVEADKPKIRFAGAMHGDEPVAAELCMRFIDHLLANYATDARVQALVDETAVWVLPLMNPDGYELGTRFSVGGYDLNRWFPAYPLEYEGTFFSDGALDTAGRPVEVQHVMRWAVEENFALAANFHTGALVVNYPYDDDGKGSVYSPTPDEMLFREISRRYSRHNPPMWASPHFPDGITNGAAWYSIPGGMQDWHYRYLGCPEVTIEVSNIKAPPASALPQLWEDNRESMLAYAEAVHLGVRGVVADSVTGEPVHAQVDVEGNTQPVFTNPAVGNYHRLLLPGEYRLVVSAPGYITRRLDPVEVGEGPAVRADTPLFTGDINGDGRIDAVDVQLVVLALLGISEPYPADVDGGGVTASDVQAVVWRSLQP